MDLSGGSISVLICVLWLQDRVLVIYSVDMLPDAADSSQLEDCVADGARGSMCRWEWHCLEDGVMSHDGQNRSEALAGSSGSQCRPVGAWGRVSHGMRVAILKTSDILSAAQASVLTAR